MTTQVYDLRDEKALATDERCLDMDAVERVPGMQSGDAIICTSGILWVTQEGDLEDYLLQEGGAFVASRQGLVVVQALTQAAYRLARNASRGDSMRLESERKARRASAKRSGENLPFERPGQRVLDGLVPSYADEYGCPGNGN